MGYYDEVDLLEMEFRAEDDTYTFPCPCGDKFFIPIEDLIDAEDCAECPSCSLILKVNYDPEAFLKDFEEDSS